IQPRLWSAPVSQVRAVAIQRQGKTARLRSDRGGDTTAARFCYVSARRSAISRRSTMGKAVAAVFTTHVPWLMSADPVAHRAYIGRHATTFYDAMLKLERERLRHLEFDTFLLIDTHWFSTLEYVLNAHERLSGVFTSEELPAMLHDLEYDYRGDPELARGVEIEARERGIRAIASAHRNLPVHYPTLNVMHYFNHEARRRVLSVSVCQTASVKNDLAYRSEEHTSELQSPCNLVCRLLLEK